MLIIQKDGSSRYGLIVGLAGAVMRVALADSEDVSEFKLVKGLWVSDECEVVSFQFPPGLAQHEAFRAAITQAIRPIERLPGYLGAEEWTTRNIN